MKQHLLEATISRFPLLQAVDEPARTLLSQRARHARIPRGRSFIWAGSEASSVYLLIAGVAKLTGRDGGGSETMLGLALPGELVGDMAAVAGQPHFFDALAASNCSAAVVDSTIFLQVLSESTRASLLVASSVARRMELLSTSAVERSSADVPARLAGRLLYLGEVLGRPHPDGIEIDLPLRQADLGLLADMSRESACKTLRRFQRDGLVDYSKTRLKLLSPQRLQAVRRGAASGGSGQQG